MASHIDGAGTAKLQTLDQGKILLARLNTIVERMAQSQKMMQPLAQYRQQIQRAAAPLASLLKPQFEPISVLVTNLVIVSTRGGSDAAKVRGMRESIGQIKAQIDSTEGRVRKQHSVESGDADSA